MAEDDAVDDAGIAEQLAAVGLTRDRILEYKEGKACSFWFVRADCLRSFGGTTPPKLQQLRKDHPDWLTQRTINFADGHDGAYLKNTLVVSHCWEESSQPDLHGGQFAAVKAHLEAHTSIEFVWYDYWSMPQGRLQAGERTQAEEDEFFVMLPNINLLYLFCSVLILQDRSYMSRFWTQFEAFLSMRRVTAKGLEAVEAVEDRCTIVIIHNAPEVLRMALVEEWCNKTATEAYDVLKENDVKVTNVSDKDLQLPKLLALDKFARHVFAEDLQ